MGENKSKGIQDQNTKDVGTQKVGQQDLGQGKGQIDKNLDQSGAKGGQAAPKNVAINQDRDAKDLKKDTDVATGSSAKLDQDLSRNK